MNFTQGMTTIMEEFVSMDTLHVCPWLGDGCVSLSLTPPLLTRQLVAWKRRELMSDGHLDYFHSSFFFTTSAF